jgi:putative transposase
VYAIARPALPILAASGSRLSILPPCMRRSKSIETLLSVLYLKGISTGDFSEALAALLGKHAAGLSASAIGRLKDGCLDEHAAWQKRDLSAKRYVYIWAEEARLEDQKQCILVLARKELVGFTDGAATARRTGAICCSI